MSNVSTPFYKLLDVSLVLIASIIAYQLRFDDWTLPPEYLVPSLTLAVFTTFGFSATGFYSETNSRVSINHFYSAALGSLLAALGTASFLYLTKTGELFSRIWFVTAVLLSLGLIVASRVTIAHLFSTSVRAKAIVLAGGSQTALNVLKKITGNKNSISNICLLKHLTLSHNQNVSEYLEEVVQSVKEFREERNPGDYEVEIWVTADIYNAVELPRLQLLLSEAIANIVYVPEFPNIDKIHSHEVQNVLGVPVINSGLSKKKKINTALKYLEDKLLGIVMTIALSPVFAIIAIAIKLDSQGPVLFKQHRHGFGGDEFEIYKFRTMTHEGSQAKFSQATKDDIRVTRVGKLLRRTSLDELPQLFNVLNGSMSLVGPRPHPVELNNDFQHKIDRFMARHSVKPGITGLAQIRGYRGETITFESMENRINSDLEYVQYWSVLLDLKILINTVAHVFLTDKAY